MKRFIEWYLMGSLLFIFGWMALSTYWTFRPYTIFTFNGATTEVVSKTLHPGDPITLKGDAIQNYAGIHCTASRTLEDDIYITFTSTNFTTTGGHVTTTVAVATIPAFTPPGTYRLRNEFVCKVNPIRSVTVVRYSDDFKVIK